MAEELGTNVDWELDINLAGVKAATGGANIEKGYYMVTIESMAPLENSPDRLMIRYKFESGQVRNEFLNKPKSADDNVRVYWRALCESVGYAPAALDKGEVKLTSKSFLGKKAHVFFDPAGNTYQGKVNPKASFLSPTTWKEQKTAFDAKASENGASSSTTPNGTAVKTASGGMSEDDVRALLSA